MRYIEKDITGYATSYKTAYTPYPSTYPWSNVSNAFDWDASVSPELTDTTYWRGTYAKAEIYWSTGDTFQWYLDGIGTFKSSLDDNLNDAYNEQGTVYTNFSCIPDDAELIQICFKVRSSMAKYNTETVKYYKNTTDVTTDTAGNKYYISYKSLSSSGIKVTENRISSGTDTGDIGHTFSKDNNGIFKWVPNTKYGIGSWTISDFKNGLFLPRVRCKSNSSSAATDYYYPRGFAVTLTCKIPAYTITTDISIPNAGTVTGAGEYFSGKTAHLTAIPNEGYRFLYWRRSDGTIWDQPEFDLVVNKDMGLTAVFEANKINKTYADTSKILKAYVNNNEVKAIYVDTTKVYE